MRKFLLQVSRTDKPPTRSLFDAIFKEAKGYGMSSDEKNRLVICCERQPKDYPENGIEWVEIIDGKGAVE